jgi:hypothetical protein
VILNLACINIYNNHFQNTLKRNPWKGKKIKWIKDEKNNKSFSIWFIYSSMEESLLWNLCVSFLKFIYLGFLAWICSRKEEKKKEKQKKIPWMKEKRKKRT